MRLGSGNRLPERDKKRITKLLSEGRNCAEIARIIGVHAVTVRRRKLAESVDKVNRKHGT